MPPAPKGESGSHQPQASEPSNAPGVWDEALPDDVTSSEAPPDEPRPTAPPEPPSEGRPTPTRARKIAGWVTDHVAATLIGLLITAGVAAGGALLFSKDEVGNQLDNLRRSFADQGFEVRYYKQIAMHPGAPSDVFVLTPPNDVKPDQLRIYDEVSGSLEQRFALDPTEVSQSVPTPGTSSTTTNGTAFEVVAVTDVNEDGQNDLVGAYTASVGTAIRVPIVIGWNSARDSYQAEPLLARSAFDPPYAPRQIPPDRQALFEKPFVIKAPDSTPMRAWAAQSLVVEKPVAGRSTMLVAAVPGPQYPEVQIGFWPLLPGRVSVFNGKPLVPMCVESAGGTTRFISRKPTSLLNPQALLTATYRETVRRDARSRARGSGPFLGAVIDGSCLVGE